MREALWSKPSAPSILPTSPERRFPMMDPRAVERTMHDLTRLIEEQGFETPEEVEEYARGFVERGEIPHYEPQTDLERAQAKMYDAWSAKRQRRRVRLAKDALSICPDCADAYVLLG